jgi:thiamine-phosphate pyrophosphorylase
MVRYYITDRKALGGEEALVRNIERQADAVDMIQVREKDLSGRALAALVRDVLRVRAGNVKVLVNDRADIALACCADGVHLRAGSFPPYLIRQIAPLGFLIGVSCHSPQEVKRAEQEAADFVVLGPVYESPGKGGPFGTEGLRQACASVRIPVLALGGVTQSQWPELEQAGAAGFAAIRAFQTYGRDVAGAAGVQRFL